MSVLCIISTAQLCVCPAEHAASGMSLLLLYLSLHLCMPCLENSTIMVASQADTVACARHELATWDTADLTGTQAATQGCMYQTLGQDMW